jgi:CHAD domain-containing protein
MNRTLPLVRLLRRRALALRRHLSAALAGKDAGVHQARVASRRLREALPVLTEGLHHTKAPKAQRKIRRLTQALGTVRELDVTLHLIDELADRPGIPRPALTEVRAQVIEAREKRRAVMLERMSKVNVAKLHRRLTEVGHALANPAPGHNWRAALATRTSRARKLEKGSRSRADLRRRGAARRADRRQEAALLARDRGESGAAPCDDAVRTIKRVQDILGRLHDPQVLQHHVADVGATPRSRRGTPDAALATLRASSRTSAAVVHGATSR